MSRAMWLGLAAAAAIVAVGTGTATAQVKIGVAGPITGGSAAFGAQLKNGAEQAAEGVHLASISADERRSFPADCAAKIRGGLEGGRFLFKPVE